MENKDFDAIIVGGSFAGLAAAHSTKAENLLILEKEKELGARQRSTCGAQVNWIKELKAEKSILKKVDTITLHSSKGNEVDIDLPTPYCTIDYKIFCESVLAQLKNTEIKTDSKVTGVETEPLKKVFCDQKEYSSHILVDASGWRAVLAAKFREGYADIPSKIAGIETEVEYEADSIHFYFGKRFAPGGYAWIFPTANGMARVGLGSFKNINILDYNKKFLDFLAIQNRQSKYHGGILPCFGLRDPVIEDMFVIGDAAGQVLPVSGEGIGKAFTYGKLCGNLISKIIEGELERHEALEIYRQSVLEGKKFYDTLLFIQDIAYRAPDWAWDKAIKKADLNKSIPQVLLRAYLRENSNHTKLKTSLNLLKFFISGRQAPT